MNEPTKESLRDQLVAEVELINHRLEELRGRVAAESADVRERFTERAEQVAARASTLASSTGEWMAVKIGTAAAVEDLGDAVDAIERDLDAEEETDAATYRSVLDRQLRAWRTRAERLRVQEALAEMDVRDDLAAVSGRLREARARALVDLRRTKVDAKETVVELRGRVNVLLEDARHVVERAADALSRE